MYGRNGVESDGDLYRMQQEAIRQARETAKNATLPPEPVRHEQHYYRAETEPVACRVPDKPMKHEGHSEIKGFGNILSGLFKNMDMEDLLLLGILVLLMIDNADDEIILLVLFLFVSGLF